MQGCRRREGCEPQPTWSAPLSQVWGHAHQPRCRARSAPGAALNCFVGKCSLKTHEGCWFSLPCRAATQGVLFPLCDPRSFMCPSFWHGDRHLARQNRFASALRRQQNDPRSTLRLCVCLEDVGFFVSGNGGGMGGRQQFWCPIEGLLGTVLAPDSVRQAGSHCKEVPGIQKAGQCLLGLGFGEWRKWRLYLWSVLGSAATLGQVKLGNHCGSKGSDLPHSVPQGASTMLSCWLNWHILRP